jgi:hypothetical protein
VRALVVAAVLVLATGRAHAYPQFQLSRDQTCSGCHLSPAGGGLLSENGMNAADAMSEFGTSPEFMYGKLSLPSWLQLGGDFRAATGYLQTPQRYLISIPMQADLYGHATYEHFSLQVTAGYRPPEYGNQNATRVWSREHYIMWQSDPGSPYGLFVRVGRLMPVFGLRFAEHGDYTRRYGGVPLFAETYAASVAYITEKYEGHITGFIKDPLIDPVLPDSGGAAYVEVRPQDNFAVGAEGMITTSADDKKYRGGFTGKYYFKNPDLLIQGEAQVLNQHIGPYGLTALISYLMVSWFPRSSVLLDLGWGHYDENLRIKGLDRDAFDLNAHWFTTSHFELLLNARLELIGQASSNVNTSGPTGSYVLLMGHYRL